MADQSDSEELDADRGPLSVQLLEDDNLSQKSTMYKMTQGHDGNSISKPVDAQLFNVDLSSVPLPPATEVAVASSEDTLFSLRKPTHVFTKKPRNSNEYTPSSGTSTVSGIALPPTPPLSTVTNTVTAMTMHLPFTSPSELSVTSSGISQISGTVPQPVPPPPSMPMVSVCTIPPLPLTPVLPVPPTPILPVGISSLQTRSIGSYSSLISSSTTHTDCIEREIPFSDDRKDGLDTSKSLSSPLDPQKDAKSDKTHLLAKTPNRITRFSLKSPDGGGKPKVSFQIKRKNRPIVGDKTESIVEEEDVVSSNPGQFVTRKREMFKPAEVESATPQQIAFIKSLEVLENVQKKAQTSPTTLETVTQSQLVADRNSPNEKNSEKAPLDKISEKISEASPWVKLEEKQPLHDKAQDHLSNEKIVLEKVHEQILHELSQESLNSSTEKSNEAVTQDNSNENLNREKCNEKPLGEKVVENISPEKSHEPLSIDRSRGKSIRDRSREHSVQERSHDRQIRDRSYDKPPLDKSRDRTTRERSGRDNSHDRSVRGQSYERSAREKSQDRNRDWDRSHDRSTRDRSHDRSIRDRHDWSRDRLNRDRSNRDRSRERSTRDRSRERSTRDRSRDRYLREKSYERSPREKSDERSLSEKPSERSSSERLKPRSDNIYEYRNSQRRLNTRDRRSRWAERHDDRSNYDKYDDNRYGRNSDRYKRDMYDNRISSSSSHYYDDDHFGRSHHDDKRSRHDDRLFYSQDKHSRSDDCYSDRYDRRSRQSIHSSEERASDLDTCLKDTGSPIRTYLGPKSNLSSGISAISVHYGQASDSDNSPVHNLEENKQYDRLQYSSASAVVSSASTTSTNQLPVFGQENQVQAYNKLEECTEESNYNYGDSTPVRDEPNDYEINFSQNTAPVNSYAGFSHLYQPNTGNMTWLGTSLEPTQSIEVSQRIPGTPNIPAVLEDSPCYPPPAVLTDIQQRGEPANIVSITPVSASRADSTRINIGIANTIKEHARIPAVLEDFPEVTHSNTPTQNVARTSEICPQNVPTVSTSTPNLSSNIGPNSQFQDSIGLPPAAIVSQLPPPVESNTPYLKITTTAFDVKLETSNYDILSGYTSPRKAISQSHENVFNTDEDFATPKKELSPLSVSDVTEDSRMDTYSSTEKVLRPPKKSLQRSADYSVSKKLSISKSAAQSPRIDSSQKQVLENKKIALATTSTNVSVESMESSAADYTKSFSPAKKDSQTKTVKEIPPSKELFASETVKPQHSKTKVKSSQLKKPISIDVVIENVPNIELSPLVSSVSACDKESLSNLRSTSNLDEKRASVTDHLGDEEVSSSEHLLSEQQSTVENVVSEQDTCVQSTPDSDSTDQKEKQICEKNVSKDKTVESEIQEKEHSVIANTTEAACSKDNFEEELMEVDSPESSCNIETNVGMSAIVNIEQPEKNLIVQGHTTIDNHDELSQISTSSNNMVNVVQETITGAPSSKEKTEDKVDTRADSKVDSKVDNEPNISTSSYRENEISSNDMQKTTSCDIPNSENIITTSDVEDNKSQYSTNLPVNTPCQTSVTNKQHSEDSQRAASSDTEQCVEFEHVDRSITTESSYSVVVTSSDERTSKLNKPKFHALRKDINRTDSQKEFSTTEKTSPVVVSPDETKPDKVTNNTSRPTTRWDVSGCSTVPISKYNEAEKPSPVPLTTGFIETTKTQVQNIFEKFAESTNENVSLQTKQTTLSAADIELTEVKKENSSRETDIKKDQTSAISSEKINLDDTEVIEKASQLISNLDTENNVTSKQQTEPEVIVDKTTNEKPSQMSSSDIESCEKKESDETKEIVVSIEISPLTSDNAQTEPTVKEESLDAEQTDKTEQMSKESNNGAPSQTEDDVTAEEILKDKDGLESSKPTTPEISIKDEDDSKDEDSESVSSQKSVKVNKKAESVPRVYRSPAPRRSGRIRSLEEKRVREKEEKKEKNGRTKKEKKQEVKTEKDPEEKDKFINEEKDIEDIGALEALVKEETINESEENKEIEKKEREVRRTRNRSINKEDDDQKEEADRRLRDSGCKQVKEDKKANEIIKEKPKRVTRNKKQMEAEKVKIEIKSEAEVKLVESEVPTPKSASENLVSIETTSSPLAVSPQVKRTSVVTSSSGMNQPQNTSSPTVQKDSLQVTSVTVDQPAVREQKKEDSLMSSRPLKVKSRWRRTMEAEWLSASASITSSSPTVMSSSISTTVPTTPSPQVSPSIQALPSATVVASTLPSLPQTLSPSSSLSLSSSYALQLSDLASPLGSQANIHQIQQPLQQPTPPSPQPSIQISSSQLSPQQKPQFVVSSTFQGPEELPVCTKATTSSTVNEDPRKSYLQKPTIETILEEEEDKGMDMVVEDETGDNVPSSVKDIQTRPDVEANKENDGSYEEIVDNIYLTERKRSKQMREVRRMVCDCTITLEDREQSFEACGEDCLNRMLMIECGSRCPCGEYCNNKRFSRHQYVDVTTFQTESKGLGLMTLEELPPHTFVMEYVGEVLDYRQFKNRTKQYAKNGQEHYYFMSLNADEVIDATYRGNKSRFINHSCDPNCETQKWTVNGMLRIGFFTKQYIEAGQEMTFDYQFESKQAQTCHCGAGCCRGTIGGKKKTPVKSKKKSVASDKKKKEFEDESNVLKLNKQWNNMSQSDDDDGDDDGDDNGGDNGDEDDGEEEQGAVKKRPHDGQIKLLMLEEEMERMSQLDGLKNKEHVLNLCRLMVRAESNDHRLSILRILQGTNEQACLRLFLDYHGLPLLWSWMADVGKVALFLKSQILNTLKTLPITNKTILQESKILPMVLKWSNELKMAADHEVETEQSNDNSSQAGTPSSVASRDERPPKKKVKFADETSSDSEMSECSRLSGMIYLHEPTAKNGLNEVVDSSDMTYTDYSNQGNVCIDDLDETRTAKSGSSGAVPKSGILIKPELQKELSSESSSSPVVDDKVQSNEAESSSPDVVEKSTKEKTEDEILVKDDDSSNEVKVAADEKNFDSSKLSSVVSLAIDLLKHWGDLKEVFKIPKKEKVEERKRTERELERDRLDRKRRYESSPDKGHSRFKTRSDRRREEVQELLNPNRPRRVLLPTPPKLSKEERRQQFEAQVRAQDEMAEYQKQQEAAYMQQQEYMQQQYNISGEVAGYDYYAQQDPNVAYQQDPNVAYQQDPNIAFQHDPNVAFPQDPSTAVVYQPDLNTGLYPQTPTYQQDPNAQYQDPNSVYHISNYHIPPPTDPTAYPIPPTDPTAYPVPPPDPTAYPVPPPDPTAYPVPPPDPTAYPVPPPDPTAYPVPPPDPTAYPVPPPDPTAYPVPPPDPTAYSVPLIDLAAYPVPPTDPTAYPVPPIDPNAYTVPPTDPNAYTVPSTDPNAYQIPPADSSGYQMHPSDLNAYQILPPDPTAYSVPSTDPNAYQVPLPDQATYQVSSTDQSGYHQAETNFQITIPPPATPVPPDSSYPNPASSPAITQPPPGTEAHLELCYIPAPSLPVVQESATSSHCALPSMTPTYMEPVSSTPTMYSSTSATPSYPVQSKYLTAPQTNQTTATYPQTPAAPPRMQPSPVPQLPPPPSQLPTGSPLITIPPPSQTSTPQTPIYVQGQQPPPPQSAPPQVYYPPTPTMVAPPPQHLYPQPQSTTPAVPGSQVVQIDQGLLALQVQQLQQQLQIHSNIVLPPSTPSGTTTTEEEPPPPPSPPKSKLTKLPPNWKMAKDAEGKNYYYHTLTRQTQWDLPTWDQREQDDMDLGTPTHDEPQNKSKKKPTTAAADTSSELAKRSKEAFRNKMSQWIVSCLNPYRKPDCRLGRISSTDDFKHLARKLTHHVMAKELKHCKHPEDLEVNENVKAKAKDYIKKYMSKFGANYKKAQSPTPDD